MNFGLIIAQLGMISSQQLSMILGSEPGSGDSSGGSSSSSYDDTSDDEKSLTATEIEDDPVPV